MKNLFTLAASLLLLISTGFAQNRAQTDSVLIEYYQTQKFAEAADYLKKTYAEPITDNKIINQLAYTSNMAGRLPDAEAYYQRLYNIDSTNLSVLYNMAGINSRRGNNVKAKVFYKRILAIDSTNANVYKQLALLSQQTADIPSAVGYLQKANRINPEDANVAFDLSAYMIQFKQLEVAEHVIDKALIADTANMLLLKGKAMVLYQQKKYPETIIACNRLMQNFDQSGQVINYKGVSEYALKRYKDCINTFKILDTLNLQSETSYYYLGMAYKALKSDNQAIAYLQKAIDAGISTNINTYYSEIGDCYDRLHQPKMALKAYQKGLSFGEKPLPMAYYAMAAIYDANLRDTANAIKYYKKYLLTNPPGDKQKSYIDYTRQRIESLHR